jgi:hypothetical protein
LLFRRRARNSPATINENHAAFQRLDARFGARPCCSIKLRYTFFRVSPAALFRKRRRMAEPSIGLPWTFFFAGVLAISAGRQFLPPIAAGRSIALYNKASI